MKRVICTIVAASAAFLALLSCSTNVKSGDLVLTFNDQAQVRVSSAKSQSALCETFTDLASVNVNGQKVDFVTVETVKQQVNDAFGEGNSLVIKSESANEPKIGRTITVNTYKAFPSTAIVKASFENLSEQEISVEGWTLCDFQIVAAEAEPYFWSFQGQSTERREDWIKPIAESFYQKNFMGMNDSDYGGGIPVTCLWRRDAGIAIGHIAPNPEIVSLPVEKKEGENFAEISIVKEHDSPVVLAAGQIVETYNTFISVYEGDCFKPLSNYSQLLEKVGVVMPESEPQAFETAWCAWGYGRGFTVEQVLGTLPKVAELGFKWATLDDGFQVAEGDWSIDTKRFKGGDADIKRIVDAIHGYGMKADIWLCPMAADPGTDFMEKYPNSVIITKTGEPQWVTYWNSYYLSPVDPDVLREQEAVIRKFMADYDFDGLKLDGQHMNAVSPDYGQYHHPEDPEKSVRELPGFYKMIYDTAREIKGDAVIQYCPCGDCFSVYNLPYTNKTVSSDPRGSYQIRTKGYVLRAIAPKTAYYGDHIELSDNGNDFPTQLGIGAVLGSKFTWPESAAPKPRRGRGSFLNPEKEEQMKNALAIYEGMKLSLGEYVPGLYDIGFDYPETHVIAKDGNLHYAFYTHKNDDRKVESVELRGLEKGKKYHVVDYYNHIDLGEITATDNTVLNVPVEGSLLLEVSKL